MSHWTLEKAKIFLAVIFLISFSVNVSSAGIGLSPVSVRFEDVLKDGYAEKSVLLSTSSTEPIECIVTATGPAREWFNYSTEKRFTLNPRSHQPLKIMVSPPSDTPNGVYEGYISVVILPKTSPDEGVGSAVSTGVSLKYYIEVSDVEKREYVISDTSVRDTEEKMPIEFSTVAENIGNVLLRPKIHIDISDAEGGGVVKSIDYSDSVILPTTRQTIAIKVSPNDLPIGKYTAKFIAYLDQELVSEQELGFEVLEKGSLRIQGRLEQVSLNKIWVYAGEIVEITASFQNDGVLSTSAVFKGKATMDDEVVALIESDEVDVPAGERANLTAHFTPKRTGRYVISGKAYFTKKITSEKSTILNVIEKDETAALAGTGNPSSGSELIPLAAVALVASIVIGLFIWKTKKKSKERA